MRYSPCATKCRHKHTYKRMHLNSHARTPMLQPHTHIYIYIYVYTFMQTYTTHLENWLLSLLSGDTCYLFCAHPTTKTSMTCFLRFIFTQKKPVKFLKRPQQMPNVIVCLDEVVWLVSGASLW